MSNPQAMSSHRLPVIDFAGYRFGDAAKRAQIAGEISAASETYGFYYLVNHGIPQETIASAFGAAREFFARPLEQRMACRSQVKNQNRGYQPMLDTQHAGFSPDVKETYDMGFPLPADDADILAGLPFHALNTWPAEPGFRAITENLYFAMLETGRNVLRAMAEALQADRNFFVARCTKPSTNMRMVHYPPQPADLEEGIGATAHTDRGIITLLLNDDNGGLQIEDAEGRWIDAPPRADALIVNVGQLMTRWTNGRFRSAVHRVINDGGRERYSIPQFHHPDYRAVVDPRELPLQGLVNFEPVVAGDFVAAGFKRDRKSWADAPVAA